MTIRQRNKIIETCARTPLEYLKIKTYLAAAILAKEGSSAYAAAAAAL